MKSEGSSAAAWRDEHDELQYFRAVVDGSPDPTFVVDAESMRFIYANETACALTGFAREEYFTIDPWVLVRRTRDEERQHYERLIATGSQGVTTEPIMTYSKDGSRKGWWETHSRAIRVNGRWLILATSREVTRRVLAEEAEARSRRMYAALSATTEAIIRTTSVDALFRQVCEVAVSAGGFSTACVLLPDPESPYMRVAGIAGFGQSLVRASKISTDPNRPEGRGLVGNAFRSRKSTVSNDFQGDERLKYWRELAEHAQLRSAAAIPILRDGGVAGVFLLYAAEKRAFDDEAIGLLERITENVAFALVTIEHEAERKLAEERVQYLATHDSLTGLPNRVLFGELLGMALRNAQRYSRTLALMFIDLDRFKAVNDTLGHEAGDTLLVEIAARLKSSVRASDVVARLGGDEFVILLQEPNLPDGAEIVAQRIVESIGRTVPIMGHDCHVAASIGIALYPAHGPDERTLMTKADTAMYVAKEHPESSVQFYFPGISSPSLARRTMEQEMREALDRGEFRLRYRPRLDLETNRVSGVEALLHWDHPGDGLIPAESFMPQAEAAGVADSITRWMLTATCSQAMEWTRTGLPPTVVTIRLPAPAFAEGTVLAGVAAALKESGLPAELLELEVTETMVMQNPSRTVRVLSDLKALGVRIAMDDFGGGYCSLSRLQGYAIDLLKVDAAYDRERGLCGPDGSPIAKAMIDVAKALSPRVVARSGGSGSGDPLVRGIALEDTNGFYFGEAASAEAFAELIRGTGQELAKA
jgi:diguanylate cyclase (GGDEF)-like protein/PAS domain S-box-containing protein